MVTHCSILAWKIPWTEEPGGLQAMWSQKVGHDLATKPQHLLFKTDHQQQREDLGLGVEMPRSLNGPKDCGRKMAFFSFFLN